MHILIALLTAIAGVVWALYRLQNSGVDLNAFNPFYWVRRRHWQKKFGTKVMHQLDNPMDAASLLVVGIAHMDGQVTRDLKQEILDLFVAEFGVSQTKATEFYAASCHLLKEAAHLPAEVSHILKPCKDKFTQQNIDSFLSMLHKVAAAEADISEAQQALIDAIKKEFTEEEKAATHWQS